MQDSGETCYDLCCRDSSGTGGGADRGENCVAKIDKKKKKQSYQSDWLFLVCYLLTVGGPQLSLGERRLHPGRQAGQTGQTGQAGQTGKTGQQQQPFMFTLTPIHLQPFTFIFTPLANSV